ncbi:MAG TPA: formate dehydrogenase accessory protein FdhE [Terriglobales bacterium]|nr:formate dehydrogenase accessory protein FdhE [Terriglobales bacterium]
MHPPTALIANLDQKFRRHPNSPKNIVPLLGHGQSNTPTRTNLQTYAVACRDPKPHNRPVANTPWQQRIRRAEKLAAQHAFAVEILGFYIHVARFQQSLYLRIEKASAKKDPVSPPGLPDSPELLTSFPSFLSLVEEKAPVRFAQVAHDLRNSSSGSWSDLLNKCWSTADEPPATPQEFLALAFLQPYAELVRSRARLQLDGYTHSLCPFCNRKPTLAVLRRQGDGARRNLVCGFCLCDWEFRRIVCAGCGQEDQAKLPVYTADQFPHVRVECCDVCHTYIKSIDLTKNGLADPMVDELASIPLDLWAQEHGYAKLHPNLLGL